MYMLQNAACGGAETRQCCGGGKTCYKAIFVGSLEWVNALAPPPNGGAGWGLL